MKVSREQFAENRQSILDVAGRLFREKGFDGVSVVDIMKGAGLTHGGFYGHFASKDDLIAQACARALSGPAGAWTQIVKQRPDNAGAAIVESYLSAKHRDRPGTGCLLAALGPDIARKSKPVRQAFTEGVRARLAILATAMTGRSRAAKQRKALAVLSGLVGALILARAVDDPSLSEADSHGRCRRVRRATAPGRYRATPECQVEAHCALRGFGDGRRRTLLVDKAMPSRRLCPPQGRRHALSHRPRDERHVARQGHSLAATAAARLALPGLRQLWGGRRLDRRNRIITLRRRGFCR